MQGHCAVAQPFSHPSIEHCVFALDVWFSTPWKEGKNANCFISLFHLCSIPLCPASLFLLYNREHNLHSFLSW